MYVLHVRFKSRTFRLPARASLAIPYLFAFHRPWSGSVSQSCDAHQHQQAALSFIAVRAQYAAAAAAATQYHVYCAPWSYARAASAWAPLLLHHSYRRNLPYALVLWWHTNFPVTEIFMH